MSDDQRICEVAAEALGKIPSGWLSHVVTQWPHLVPRIQFYSHPDRAVVHKKVPWPLVVLLGFRGEKCILGGGRYPVFSEFTAAYERFVRRVRTAAWASTAFGMQRENTKPKLHAANPMWHPPAAPPVITSLAVWFLAASG